MYRIHDCIDTVRRYYPNADVDLIYKAYVFAGKVHGGYTRLSGEPYLSHPIEVAMTLASMKMDVVTVTTGLLHDVLEDTETTPAELTELFGDEVAQLVEGLTKISKFKFPSREEYQAENLRKMMLAIAKDIRVLIVKLADRLHNVRTLNFAKEEHQKRVAQETLDIYAPLANRLGLGLIRAELEDEALKYLEPEIYQQLLNRINETEVEHQQVIEIVKQEIEKKLQEHHIEATISARQKHLYSIYRKMQHKGIAFKDVMDVIGLRVITNTKADCYATLGIIHSLWTHIPTTFDDYITMPKPNMYQSLHTAIMGPFGKPVEIQIRTWEMHHLAEEGIATHWRYKEGKEQEDDYDQKFFGLKHILEWQQELKNPAEFVEHLKIDLFPDEVYVFTPDGEVKCLPRGATTVDFAYAVHSEVGDHCAGAKINERIVPLETQLSNGDIVEIIIQKNHYPSSDWLSFVMTSKARTKIRHFLRAKEREKHIQLGTGLLEKAIRKAGGKFATLRKDGTLKRVIAELGVSNEEELFAAIGSEKYSTKQVLEKIYPEQKPLEHGQPQGPGETQPSEPVSVSVTVGGMGDIFTRIGNCCKPLPGDKIVGFVTRGRGITIHKVQCPNILALDLEDGRIIDVKWDTNAGTYYPTELYITGKARPSMLADIIAAITKTDTDILNSSSDTSADQLEVRCVVQVLDRNHLESIIRSVRNVRSVSSVRQDGFAV
jgi:guanosine-3',5'-bis(diphosphate) 3'-pyrophosphohydrolase